MIGTLVHITANKKLMILISEDTYDNIYNRLYNECKKKSYPTERLAVYTRENDDGEDEYFAMVTPDKYDKLNMPKFERLLRKEVNFSTRMKSYDFIPAGETEPRQGINMELIRIHQRVHLKQQNACVDEIDEIADKAAARAINPPKELNVEEQAIDEDVEKKAAVATGMPVATTGRRRRTVPAAKEASLTALEAQMKALEAEEE